MRKSAICILLSSVILGPVLQAGTARAYSRYHSGVECEADTGGSNTYGDVSWINTTGSSTSISCPIVNDAYSSVCVEVWLDDYNDGASVACRIVSSNWNGSTSWGTTSSSGSAYTGRTLMSIGGGSTTDEVFNIDCTVPGSDVGDSSLLGYLVHDITC